MSASSSSPSKPTIGILSIGDMGLGIAKLLQAHDYTVLTSTSTLDRIKAARIISLPSDEAFAAEADIILSIVPPRDAVATARRIVDASRAANTVKQRKERKNLVPVFEHSIAYIDLNAISSKTAKVISSIITSEASPTAVRRRSSSFSFTASPSNGKALAIDFLDGGIIGGPPSQNGGSWKRPSLVISGPKLDTLLDSSLQKTLSVKNIADTIGPASALKCCFASLTKGMTALAILSYTTAHICDVLPELQDHLAEFAPNIKTLVESGLPVMPPKAYRWVDEMRQIGETFGDEGGFTVGMGGRQIYDGVAEVYKFVAEDTVLGEEKMEKRKRGKIAEDVAVCIAEGVKRRRREDRDGIRDGKEDLSLTWRGSWS